MNTVIFAVVVLGVLGALFGCVLAFASKIFEVKKDPREEAVLACLAGANCGGCGYPGCSGCAAAIVAGDAPVTACAPAGPENAAKIAEIGNVLSNVTHGETLGLLLCMVIPSCLLMFIAFLLYKKFYTLDEPEYDRICKELAKRNGK